MAKDKTVVGITGKPIPKPRTARQQYELEKKRRMEKHLGKNVGGVQYSSDVTPYYNPRARTFREFIEIAEAITDADRRLARTGLVSKRADDLQREIDAVTSGKKPKQQTGTRSARTIKRSELSSMVKEEDNINEAPYQIYGPGPHGPSDAEPQPLGKPYQNKKRAKTRADKLDQEIGGYRHFVRKVD